MEPIDDLMAAAREAADLLSAFETCSRNNFANLACEVEEQLRKAIAAVQNEAPDNAVVRVSARPDLLVVDAGEWQEIPPDVPLSG